MYSGEMTKLRKDTFRLVVSSMRLSFSSRSDVKVRKW